MNRGRRLWMLGSALLLAVSLRPAVSPAQAGGGYVIDPVDDPPAIIPWVDLVVQEAKDSGPFECEPPQAIPNPQTPWTIDAFNESGFAVSHDYIYFRITIEGKTHLYLSEANLGQLVQTHFMVESAIEPDTDPEILFCHNPIGIVDTPDPVVNIRQNPPPELQ